NRFDGVQRKGLGGSQLKSRPDKKPNDGIAIYVNRPETIGSVRGRITDRKIFATHALYGKGRFIKPFHAARSELRSTADSSQSHGKMKSQNRTQFNRERWRATTRLTSREQKPNVLQRARALSSRLSQTGRL